MSNTSSFTVIGEAGTDTDTDSKTGAVTIRADAVDPVDAVDPTTPQSAVDETADVINAIRVGITIAYDNMSPHELIRDVPARFYKRLQVYTCRPSSQTRAYWAACDLVDILRDIQGLLHYTDAQINGEKRVKDDQDNQDNQNVAAVAICFLVDACLKAALKMKAAADLSCDQEHVVMAEMVPSQRQEQAAQRAQEKVAMANIVPILLQEQAVQRARAAQCPALATALGQKRVREHLDRIIRAVFYKFMDRPKAASAVYMSLLPKFTLSCAACGNGAYEASCKYIQYADCILSTLDQGTEIKHDKGKDTDEAASWTIIQMPVLQAVPWWFVSIWR